MKKLFLSSGIVLCLATPAFATGISVVNGQLEEADCDYDTLGVYEGDAYLEAKWVPNIGTITLVSSIYPGNDTTQTATYTPPAVTAASPSTLYSVYGVGLYSTQPTEQTIDNFTTANRLSSITVPSKAGYTFDGFYKNGNNTALINSSGAIQYDAASTQITASGGSETWYAHWTAHTGTLSYNCGTQPGTTSLAANATAPTGGTLTYGQSFALATTAGSCAYAGYTFAGWSCNYNLAEGTANSLQAPAINYPATNGTIVTGHTGTYGVTDNSVSVVCSARWTPNQIGLSWDLDGGTAGATSGGTSCYYDGDVVLPANPTRTGYTFAGWEVTSVTPATP